MKQIKSLEADSSDLETPISMSLDLQVLRQSDKPEERSLADLLAAVSDMRSIVGKVEGKLPAIEEVQVSLKALSSRLEDYLDSPPIRRRYRLQPMMVHEMIHFSERGGSREVAILVIASMFRENFPWVYEAGMEAYRALKRGDGDAAREAMDEFRNLAEMTWHTPWGREFLGGGKESMMLMEELRSLIHEFIPLETHTKRTRRRGELSDSSDSK